MKFQASGHMPRLLHIAFSRGWETELVAVLTTKGTGLIKLVS